MTEDSTGDRTADSTGDRTADSAGDSTGDSARAGDPGGQRPAGDPRDERPAGDPRDERPAGDPGDQRPAEPAPAPASSAPAPVVGLEPAPPAAPEPPAASSRGNGILLGRLFGIPVYVAPTWFVVAAGITWALGPAIGNRLPDIGQARYLVAFAFVLLLYLSVLVHELSHSVVALRFGLPVRRISLYLLGGVSEIDSEPPTPGRELLVAVAGPLLSITIGGICLGLGTLLHGTSVASVLLDELTDANFVVGGFNLLPGLPLDGGRMLRAGVWKLTGRPLAGTVAAAWAGRALAVLVLALPVLGSVVGGGHPAPWSSLWSALIAAFIWLSASQALAGARLRERLPGLRARGLTRRAIPVTPDLPLAEALRRAGLAGALALVVVDHDGKPTALVEEAAVTAVPEQRRPWVAVGGYARDLEPGLVISAELSGEALVEALQAAPASEYLVVEPTGEIYGVLSTGDVERAVAQH